MPKGVYERKKKAAKVYKRRKGYPKAVVFAHDAPTAIKASRLTTAAEVLQERGEALQGIYDQVKRGEVRGLLYLESVENIRIRTSVHMPPDLMLPVIDREMEQCKRLRDLLANESRVLQTWNKVE